MCFCGGCNEKLLFDIFRKCPDLNCLFVFSFTVSKPDAENPIVKKAKIPKPELKIDSEKYQKNGSSLNLIGTFRLHLLSFAAVFGMSRNALPQRRAALLNIPKTRLRRRLRLHPAYLPQK